MSIASVDDIKISKPVAPRKLTLVGDPFLFEQLTEDETRFGSCKSILSRKANASSSSAFRRKDLTGK